MSAPGLSSGEEVDLLARDLAVHQNALEIAKAFISKAAQAGSEEAAQCLNDIDLALKAPPPPPEMPRFITWIAALFGRSKPEP